MSRLAMGSRIRAAATIVFVAGVVPAWCRFYPRRERPSKSARPGGVVADLGLMAFERPRPAGIPVPRRWKNRPPRPPTRSPAVGWTTVGYAKPSRDETCRRAQTCSPHGHGIVAQHLENPPPGHGGPWGEIVGTVHRRASGSAVRFDAGIPHYEPPTRNVQAPHEK